MSTESEKTPENGGARLNRRDALARLGLAATVAYAAPMLLQLKGASARSSGGSGGCHGHHGRHCKVSRVKKKRISR